MAESMAEKEIVLIRSVRKGVEKLEFNSTDGTWRAVLTRPGAAQDMRPAEPIKRYFSTEEAWKDVAEYVSKGFKIVYTVN
jgi:hypothetical protein